MSFLNEYVYLLYRLFLVSASGNWSENGVRTERRYGVPYGDVEKFKS